MQYRQTRLAIDLLISNLKHRLALIDSSPKKISSSAAHAEVRSSLLFNGRAERAEKRFSDLVKAIEEQYRHKMILRFFQKKWRLTLTGAYLPRLPEEMQEGRLYYVSAYKLKNVQFKTSFA